HLADRSVVEAVALHHAGAVVLDENVGAFREVADGLRGRLIVDVHGERALAGVERGKAGLRAHHLAALRLFHLDDFGAELREVEGSERTGDDVREIDHPHAGERLGHGGSLSRPWPTTASQSSPTWRSRSS